MKKLPKAQLNALTGNKYCNLNKNQFDVLDLQHNCEYLYRQKCFIFQTCFFFPLIGHVQIL